MRHPILTALLLALALAFVTPAHAEPDAPKSLWERETLFGDAGGLRPALAARGVTVSLQLTSEVWGSPSAKAG